MAGTKRPPSSDFEPRRSQRTVHDADMKNKYNTKYHPIDEGTRPNYARKLRHKDGKYSQPQDIDDDGNAVESVEPREAVKSPPKRRKKKLKPSRLAHIQNASPSEGSGGVREDSQDPAQVPIDTIDLPQQSGDGSPQQLVQSSDATAGRSNSGALAGDTATARAGMLPPTPAVSSSSYIPNASKQNPFMILQRSLLLLPFDLYCKAYTEAWHHLASRESPEESTMRFRRTELAPFENLNGVAISQALDGPPMSGDDRVNSQEVVHSNNEGSRLASGSQADDPRLPEEDGNGFTFHDDQYSELDRSAQSDDGGAASDEDSGYNRQTPLRRISPSLNSSVSRPAASQANELADPSSEPGNVVQHPSSSPSRHAPRRPSRVIDETQSQDPELLDTDVYLTSEPDQKSYGPIGNHQDHLTVPTLPWTPEHSAPLARGTRSSPLSILSGHNLNPDDDASAMMEDDINRVGEAASVKRETQMSQINPYSIVGMPTMGHSQRLDHTVDPRRLSLPTEIQSGSRSLAEMTNSEFLRQGETSADAGATTPKTKKRNGISARASDGKENRGLAGHIRNSSRRSSTNIDAINASTRPVEPSTIHQGRWIAVNAKDKR